MEEILSDALKRRQANRLIIFKRTAYAESDGDKKTASWAVFLWKDSLAGQGVP